MDFKAYLKQQELSKTTAEMYHYQTMNFISFLDKDNTFEQSQEGWKQKFLVEIEKNNTEENDDDFLL